MRNTEEKKVTKVVEQVLIDSSDNPYDAVEASVAAAIDENVDLDGVFFLLRRQPDILQKLLSASPPNDSGTCDDNKNGCDGNDGVGGGVTGITGTGSSGRKRKRNS